MKRRPRTILGSLRQALLVTLIPMTAVAQAPTPPPPPAPPSPSTGNGRLISFDFKDADVVNLLRILAAESGRNIVISDDVKGKMSLTLRNVPWEQALDVILESRGLEKIDRGNVLRIVTREQLAREREAVARIEAARITAEQAKSKADFELREKAADAELKEQQAQQRRLATEAAIAEQQARGPLREETIRLAYADPDEVARTLSGILGIAYSPTGVVSAAPVVPPAGPPFSALYGLQPPAPSPEFGTVPPAEVLAKGITIRPYRPTNSIFIRHYEKDLERIKKLVREQLDVPLPQIKIEARMNELSRRDLFDIGVSWSGGGARQAGRNVLTTQGVNPGQGPNSVFAAAPGTPGAVPPPNTLPVASGLGLPAQLPISSLTGLPLGGNIVNLPLQTTGLPTAAIGFGIIGTNFSLNLALEALEFLSKTRSLSRPEIVTVENAKASISLGSEIPYATVSSAGTQVQFKEAVLKLEVVPTVIRETAATKIKMKVVIEDNSKGTDVSSGSAGGSLPSINKRRAETEVVVREGQSLVIGGINQRTEVQTTNKVPMLGDIPVFGWLFKTRSTAVDPDRELVVFITPSVLRDPTRSTAPSIPPAR